MKWTQGSARGAARRHQVVQPLVREQGTVLTDPVCQANGDATFEFQVQGTSTDRDEEITCVYPPEFEAGREACHGYHNHVLIPHAGDHVRITGPLVRGLVHDAEFPNLKIHPAVTIVGTASRRARRLGVSENSIRPHSGRPLTVKFSAPEGPDKCRISAAGPGAAREGRGNPCPAMVCEDRGGAFGGSSNLPPSAMFPVAPDCTTLC